MNPYCEATLQQIDVAIKTIEQIVEKLEDKDLQYRPTEGKSSLGELLEHIALICKADFLIGNGYSKEQIDSYYNSVKLTTLGDIKRELLCNFQELEESYAHYSEEQLQETVTSYWGVTYTRFQWLVEIVVHLYHHRGQLHAMLVHCYGKDLDIMMFE